MADMDMIPRSYHEAVRVKRSMKAFAVALAALLLLGSVSVAAVRWRIGQEMPLLARLRSSTEQTDDARKQLEAGRLSQAGLKRKLAALTALRGAGEAARVTGAIDKALNGGVWFKQLRFSRDDQAIAAGEVEPVHSGYTIVLPTASAGKGAVAQTQTWRLSKNIEISGEAIDHAALTDFMRRLSLQLAISDVRFLNSSAHATETGQVIAFSVMAATSAVNGAKP